MTTKTAKRTAMDRQRTSSATQTNTQMNGSKQKKQKTLQDLLESGLHDMYSAEMQLLEALPKLAKAAYHEDFQDAIEFHLEQTKRHVERLDKVFSRLNIEKKESHVCAAMEGLISEAQEIIDEYEESPVRDSALIIAAQKVEHYEIASYGSLCELSDVLGYWNIHDILGRTLNEEELTDHDLSDLAIFVNDEACELSDELNEELEEKEEEEEEEN